MRKVDRHGHILLGLQRVGAAWLRHQWLGFQPAYSINQRPTWVCHHGRGTLVRGRQYRLAELHGLLGSQLRRATRKLDDFKSVITGTSFW